MKSTTLPASAHVAASLLSLRLNILPPRHLIALRCGVYFCGGTSASDSKQLLSECSMLPHDHQHLQNVSSLAASNRASGWSPVHGKTHVVPPPLANTQKDRGAVPRDS